MKILSKCRKLGNQIFCLSRIVGLLRFSGVIKLTLSIIFLASAIALRHSATFYDIATFATFCDIKMSQIYSFSKPISSAGNNILCVPMVRFFHSRLNEKPP